MTDSIDVGLDVSFTDGTDERLNVGSILCCLVGVKDGVVVGLDEGPVLCSADGTDDKPDVGLALCTLDGTTEGCSL